MFEEIIATLEEYGVEYTEDFEAGTLNIDITTVEKTDLIAIIQALTNQGFDFDIDEAAITVHGGDIMTEEDMMDEEAPEEDFNLEEFM
jgi:hypothetical protein